MKSKLVASCFENTPTSRVSILSAILSSSLVFIGLIFAVGCSQKTADQAKFAPTAASDIIGGQTVPEPDDFKAVFRLPGGCTATFISNRVFVTSAHCIHQESVEMFETKATLIKHPGFNTKAFTDSYDVALGILDKELTTPEVLKPINICTVTEPQSLINQKILFIGYGCDSASRTGAGIKRYSYATITQVEKDFLETVNPKGAVSCPGDSGAPYLLIDQDQKVCYVATNFYSDRLTKSQATNSFYPEVLEWVKKTLADRQLKVCGIDTECESSTIPENMKEPLPL